MAGKAQTRSLRTPLGRVRGLGSAKTGTHHWWMQRVTSLALLPLLLWFILSVFGLLGASHAEARAFVAAPVNAVLLLLTVGIMFHHIASGLQVVVEDYVRAEMPRLFGVLLIKAACLVLALVAGFSILRVAFT